MKIIVSFEAFNSIYEHAINFPSNEIGGFLFGNSENKRLFIKHAYKGKQSGSSVHVELGNIEMLKAIQYMETKHPKLKLIGWYHSHPGMGAHFFSQTDILTQNKYQIFYNYAIALVIDPKKKNKKKSFIPCDLQAWNVKNNVPVNHKLFFGKSFKNKKDKRDNHLKLLSNKIQDLIKIERFMQDRINGNIEMNLTRSKYHVNFQQNNKKILMKLFTIKHLNFEFFDILVYGNFKNKLNEESLNLIEKNNIKLKLIKSKKRYQPVILLKGVDKIKISDFLEILKKFSFFWK